MHAAPFVISFNKSHNGSWLLPTGMNGLPQNVNTSTFGCNFRKVTPGELLI